MPTDPGSTKALRRSYEASAQVHEVSAEDMRVSGNRVMAEYHEQEVDRARHNADAAECGAVSWFIFDVLLDSDACEIKNVAH